MGTYGGFRKIIEARIEKIPRDVLERVLNERAVQLRCERCEATGAVLYRQSTMYVEEAPNWVVLCAACREDNDDDWRERWEERHRDQMRG